MSTHSDRLKALTDSIPTKCRVANGIAFLNENNQHWRSKVDVQKIDIGNSKHCMLGQVFGDYYIGCKQFNLSFSETERLGFLAKNCESILEIAFLNFAWRRALRSHLPWYKRLFSF